MWPKEEESAKNRDQGGGSNAGLPCRAQPQFAASELKGSAVEQKVRRGSSESGDSPRSFLSRDNSRHQADPAAGRMAGIGRGKQNGGSCVAAPCPTVDQRAAPHHQRQDSALPRSGSQRAEVNRNRESDTPQGRSAPGGAKGPVARAGHQQQPQTSMHSPWPALSRYLPFLQSADKPAGESSRSSAPTFMKQSRTEVRSSSIPDTDETLSKANPVEAALKVLRSSSHPQSAQFLRALESPIQIMIDLLNENQHLQKELNDSQSLQECLRAEIKQLQRQPSSKGVPEHYLMSVNQRLQQELQELKSTQETLLAHWQAENQKLQHELEELQKNRHLESETMAEKMPAPRMKAFTVQVQRTGETHGYEKHFMWDVVKLLNCYKISLQVEEYQEGSKHPLLLFSPIGSRPGTDIENALSGLKSVQNVLLVVLHHKPKRDTKFFADIMPEPQHPALVGTVNARFSTEDGFYPCQMNQDAVEYVAAAIRTFT